MGVCGSSSNAWLRGDRQKWAILLRHDRHGQEFYTLASAVLELMSHADW